MLGKTLPCVLVRNEEYFIQSVLRPLTTVFERALLLDTGSSDRTVLLAAQIPGMYIEQAGEQDPVGITKCRQTMQDIAMHLGYEWVMQVDGDELYTVETLSQIVMQGMPHGKLAGFTTMVSVEQDEAGRWWTMRDRFSRLAILAANTVWTNEYPFESPSVFGNPSWFHYFDNAPGLQMHGLHLHRLARSSKDAEVMGRQDKQYKYSLQTKNVPRDEPLDAEYWGLA